MSFFIKISGMGLIIAIVITAVFYYGKIQIFKENNGMPITISDAELKSKIGQMIIMGFQGAEVSADSAVVRDLQNLNIGGVILFNYDTSSKTYPRNIVSPAQTKKLISDLQSYVAESLFISVDAEGGSVNRLKKEYGFLDILSAKDMGKDATLKTTEAESLKLARELKELGFNMNFAPVVDVDVNPQNPVIGALGRSFSSDANEVIRHASVVIKNLVENNIIPVEKHFPGHGSSTSDSHLGLVDVTDTYEKEELNPYIELQKEGLLDAVMTAHVINRSVDANYPATLSPLFIEKILREKVGFGGVVISDDMQMNAIVNNYGFKDSVILAINAGCDILLISNNGLAPYDSQLPRKAVDIIFNAVKDGSISSERIIESYNRIHSLKKKFGIIP